MAVKRIKLDILVFGAHPDDVELGCAGTILRHVVSGKKVGIVDLTRGELGTRGNVAVRNREARAAAKILGVLVRRNLNFEDGFFKNDKRHQLAIIKVIRQYQPSVVLAPSFSDRHPDHARAALLIEEAGFLSGLAKIQTQLHSRKQNPWRPEFICHYIQDRFLQPHFVTDISRFMGKKMQAIQAFRSQFYNPDSKEMPTYISTPEFLEGLYTRAKAFGKMIGVEYGEGFNVKSTIQKHSLFS